MEDKPFPKEVDGHKLDLGGYDTVVDITFPDNETWPAYYNLDSLKIDYEREPSKKVKEYLEANFGYFMPIMERAAFIKFASEKIALQYLADLTGKRIEIGIMIEE